MRGLWITRQCPEPANSGELLYSGGLIHSLARAGMKLTVLCCQDDALPAQRDGVDWVLSRGRKANRILSLASKLPSDAWRMASSSVRWNLCQQINEGSWDAIFVDQAAMGWCLPFLIDARRESPGLKIVYVSHNCEAAIRPRIAEASEGNRIMRWLMRLDAAKYAKLEETLARESDLITCITSSDAAHFQSQDSSADTVVLTPGFTGTRPHWRVLDPALPRRVVMSGSFEWIAKRMNLEKFLRIADPIFLENEIELQIVGKAVPAFAERIRTEFRCCRFDCNVPSVEPYLRQARMGLIVEEVGGGFKLKALEYVLHSLPIAALEGATAGLPLEAGSEMLTREGLYQLANAIANLIDESCKLRDMSRRAYDKCFDEFNWSDRGPKLMERLHSLDGSLETDAHASPAKGLAAPQLPHNLQPAFDSAQAATTGGSPR